ncbi:MAG: TlyA family RNA methyltransferase [Bauldia sp.]|nr:TlyA family RNA methyltransferase [Bauldia sp.]
MIPDRPTRERLDQALVSRGLARSRAQARDAILRGHVTVDGAAAQRPAMMVEAAAAVAVDDPSAGYVSRAALKLIAGLDAFGYDPAGRVALDLGASTGGFTQVLLERGAARVFAVDVGHGQLAPALAGDARIVAMEGVNARDLTPAMIAAPVDAVTADLSFISLRLALPPALELARPGAFAVILVKPQFEVGRDGLGKGGIVRDPVLAERAATDVAGWVSGQPGWTVDGLIPSPIAGGDGNREFLLGARRG